MSSPLSTVAGWVADAERVTVLTGAGISTDSGIPDFRGPNGVWTRDPAAEKLFTLDNYLADPQVRRRAWLARRDNPAWSAQPGPGHRALVTLQRTGRLHTIVTQNIDGLHQKAGVDPGLIVEVHGNMFGVLCMTCDDRTTMREALDRVAAGEPDPACRHCGGILKSTTVYFGEPLDRRDLERAFDAAAGCDLFLAVGTSLQVHPIAGLVDVAAGVAGARVVIVNAEPTPYDAMADAVLRDPIADVLPALVATAKPKEPGTAVSA
ncbi:MAG: Sir2 family NAD-dependent protein deacetylase [Micromonosporaceae bacterium]